MANFIDPTFELYGGPATEQTSRTNAMYPQRIEDVLELKQAYADAPYAPELHGVVARDLPGSSRKTERPWHRAAMYLLASGLTQQAVADALGRAPESVAQLVASPWFQQRLTEHIHRNGGGDIMQALQAESQKSLAVLIRLRDDEKVSPMVRSNIARDILDRVCGKATQRVEVQRIAESTDPVDEVKQLEEEMKRLASGLLGGKN